MAFDDERGVAVDKEQKIGANNIVVVNKRDLPADAPFVGDVDRGGIEIVTVQRVCDEGIKFDDECGKIFLRLLQRSSHGRKITWGNGAGVRVVRPVVDVKMMTILVDWRTQEEEVAMKDNLAILLDLCVDSTDRRTAKLDEREDLYFL